MAEGTTEPVDRDTPKYQKALKKCQEEVGTLMWLAIKTRGDIAANTSIAASIQSRNPEEALNITANVWQYLAMTWNEVTVVRPVMKGGKPTMEIVTDASLAPEGDKSRTGVVITLNDVVVHWQSSRQSIVSISSCESEINASMTGLKLGMSIRQMVEDSLGQKSRSEADR